MQFSSLTINSSLQNNPKYKFLIEIREHWHFADLVSGHLLAIYLGQHILPTLLNIYDKSCGNPFGSFRYKWGLKFWHSVTVSIATAAILKIPRPECTLEMGIHLPVKFSKDRIIILWEFGRTSSFGEEEEE
jgi:hypothetical protein